MTPLKSKGRRRSGPNVGEWWRGSDPSSISRARYIDRDAARKGLDDPSDERPQLRAAARSLWAGLRSSALFSWNESSALGNRSALNHFVFPKKLMNSDRGNQFVWPDGPRPPKSQDVRSSVYVPSLCSVSIAMSSMPTLFGQSGQACL